ncbi:MAG: Omp28-related outer membrane protein [Bacteroidota bacterium]|nr:Omp28-related outer membrane protein [Bacteroidota bacterium]
MKKIYALLLLAGFLGISVTGFSQARKFVLLEHFTQASCSPCAAQNPYLQAVLNVNRGNVNHIAYHTSWPGVDPMNAYNRPQVADRVNYYGVTGVPDVIMLGNQYEGGPTGVSQALLNTAMTDHSPIRVRVTETSDGTNRTAHVKVFTLDTIPSANYKIRVAVVEKWIHYTSAPGTNGEKDFPDVFRKMIPSTAGDSYTPAAIGDSISFDYTYALDKTTWDTTQIYSIAFIQNDATKEVINSGSSIGPAWELYGVNVPYQNATYGDHKTIQYKMANLGNTTGHYRIIFNPSKPADWTSGIIIDGTSYPDSVDVTIPAKTIKDLTLDLTIGDKAGLGIFNLAMKSLDDTLYDPQQTNAYVFVDLRDLVINNDGSWGNGSGNASDFQNSYINSLVYAGAEQYGVINSLSMLKASQYNCLNSIYNFWFNVSWSFPSLTDDNVAFFSSRLDAGRNLFLSGQDIAWDTESGDGYGTTNTKAFFTNYMCAKYKADGSTSNNMLIPNTYDTIFGQLPTSSLTNVYGSGNFYPDEIDSVGLGHKIFFYNTSHTKKCGLRSTNGTWKVVYLAPSLEFISDTNMRNEFIKTTRDWFNGSFLGVPSINVPQDKYLGQSYPNPTDQIAQIPVDNINKDMTFRLLDLTGRILKTSEVFSGTKQITVNTGSLANGLYVYQLVDSGRILDSGKLQVLHR